MYSLDSHQLVYQEQLKDRMRDKKNQKLLQVAGLHNGVSLKLYQQVVIWLGMQMVRWGSRLESLGTAGPSQHVTVNR
jgi:hypothetical protein